ncbi:Flp family type IVb pilin [Gellertiella hungarica]|uniref:Pilus assembly protein Flp/PilA n=1 Tax=Gellertiella hungarica TaxID=1572859 RepID=A0A7W6J5K0_9HYPH|nr:Flp family type IVb pilin [Gellertiella hungarica]MBB4065190.1 pilus assembly protein Flp/PilA [Gellertiella hungarica]
MLKLFKSFAADTRGATAIEYGLIAALIAVAIIPALLLFTDKFKETYDYLTTQMGGTP